MEESSRRSLRRHHEERIKEKTKKRLRRNYSLFFGEPDDRVIGIESTTKCRCSGYCCGNPRKHFNRKTLQEMKYDIATKNMLDELEEEDDFYGRIKPRSNS